MAVCRAGWGLQCRDPLEGEGGPGVSGCQAGAGLWLWPETALAGWVQTARWPMPGTLSLPLRAQECLDKFTESLNHKLDSHAVRGGTGGTGGGEQRSLWPDPPLPISAPRTPAGASRCHPAHAAAANPDPGQGVSWEGKLVFCPSSRHLKGPPEWRSCEVGGF